MDTHFHILEMKRKGIDVPAVLDGCYQNGFVGGIDIGIRADDLAQRIQLLQSYDTIFLTAGLHPGEAGAEDIEARIHLLEEHIKPGHIIALGEMGLDWYRNHGTPEKQKQLFAGQIELANQLKLPIIVHNRDADREVLELLNAIPPRRGGIMHCFSSGYEAAKQYIEKGFFISFAGNVTYKKARPIQEAAARIPLDRLLLETDAPYLAPQAVRGKPNHPGNIGYTYRFVAALREIELDELISRIQSNFTTLFPSTATAMERFRST
jgi:TatD DNase family protein